MIENDTVEGVNPPEPVLTEAMIAQSLGMPYTPELVVVEETPPEPEPTIRPGQLLDMIGQARVRRQLGTMLQAALRENRQAEHCLFLGPPGLGKTTLALTVARYMGKRLFKTNSLTLHSPTMVVKILQDLEDGDVLFVDEIHLLTKKVAASFLTAMEDGTIEVVSGTGKNKTSIEVEVAKFTLVGATTEPGGIPQPLYDRFGFVGEVEFYSTDELTQIIERAATKLDNPVDVTPEAAKALALRARGTPRAGLRLLRKVRDVGKSTQEPDENGEYPRFTITEGLVNATLGLFQIDKLGLTPQDVTILRDLLVRHNGGPVGVKALAATTGIDQRSIENLIEPMLIRLNLMSRGTNGRVATVAAYEHLGISPVPFDIRHQLR